MAISHSSIVVQCCLGDLYSQGLGVKRDYSAAKKCYELAAEGGVPEAKNRLVKLASILQGKPFVFSIFSNRKEKNSHVPDDSTDDSTSVKKREPSTYRK